MYPSQFSSFPDGTGISKFTIEGAEFYLRLNSFEDHQTIEKMLEEAFDQGRSFGADAILDTMVTAGKIRRQQFST
jgi:hypothetical protein